MHWPFRDLQSHFLVLVCPQCGNRWRFHATRVFGDDTLGWICDECGHHENLEAKGLLKFNEFTLDFSKRCQNPDYQWDSICILRN